MYKYKKLNKEDKKQWLVALRSGKFKQGTSVLKDKSNNYCCLGVFCKIKDRLGKVNQYDTYNISGFDPTLPSNMISTDTQDKLISLNDSERKSFKEIADWIENNL